MEVSVDDLRRAAGTMNGLAADVAPSVSDGLLWPTEVMPGSATAAALGRSPAAKTQACTVMQGRYHEMGDLLTASANNYHGTDEDAARRLDAMGDLNAG
ncbi:type VII secretion target [Antrihabitans cavernicola]|uniref:type VII secretion target n=1 Tax=Antrihabitans cavernicola TaxID=2495913 RepID=UPI001659EC05|nr:type VII secretion target [Spelaeibacter cavernicola]